VNKTVAEPVSVRITDTTLRDGSHAVAHQFTKTQVRDIVAALDGAGVPVIEVTNGDGLAGSSFSYGFSGTAELDLISVAADTAKHSRIAVLLLPGVGTITDLRRAYDAGAQVARIATHCTEADVSIQYFGAARDVGMETVGFLMLSHRVGPDDLARQARIMADAGCQRVYIVDSAGTMLPDGVADRVRALRSELGDDAQVGVHAHQNLCMGVANSVAGYHAGAQQIDGTLCALGAGAGNTPIEVLVTVFEMMAVSTGIDPAAILAAAAEVARPMIHRLPIADRNSIIQGLYGVYNSFLLHAERASERYGVPSHEILTRVGRLQFVGGQEDMIIDVALEIANEQDAAARMVDSSPVRSPRLDRV
jgi:4-hydroxy 2-oxovalerate aldolase